jgi:hypothetical protein
MARAGSRQDPGRSGGQVFGRDTSTMINGVNKLESEMEQNQNLRERIYGILEEIRRSAG